MSPKIPTTLPLPGDEAVRLNHKYVIVQVEKFTSDVQGYIGYRVTLDGGTDNMLAIPLWAVEVAGRLSKLGAFIVALGDDTDKWLKKVIEFTAWADKNRLLKVVK